MTTPDHFWKKIPLASRVVFLLGVFFIFGIIGSAVDTMGMGLQSTTRYLVSMVLFGVFAMVYAISGIFLRWRSGIVIPVVILVEMVVMGHVLQSVPTPNQMGTADITHMQRRLALDAGMTIGSMVLAYVCFIYVFISEGRRYFRVHAEMELASEIHRVLVPNPNPKGFSIMKRIAMLRTARSRFRRRSQSQKLQLHHLLSLIWPFSIVRSWTKSSL